MLATLELLAALRWIRSRSQAQHELITHFYMSPDADLPSVIEAIHWPMRSACQGPDRFGVTGETGKGKGDITISRRDLGNLGASSPA